MNSTMNEKQTSGAIMNMKKTRLMFIAMALITGLCGIAGGQERSRTDERSFIDRTPGMFQRFASKLGDRMRNPNKERIVYEGMLTDASGKSSSVKVIHQLDGKVRLEGFGRARLSFDGERSIGATSKKDEALLETFIMDSPEGMLSSIQKYEAVRVLGHGFGPDPAVEPNYQGPRYDIYEVTAKDRSRKDGPVRMKRYYFDSKTGLLESVRYYDRTVSPPNKIMTRYAEWGINDGSLYPSRIERYEGGQLVFSFRVETISAAPAVEAENYR
jgi:hypothetical protein